MTTILQPDEWGMRWARPPVPQSMPVGEVFIHHTAGRDPMRQPIPGKGDPKTAFRLMNESAIITDGYSATDYSMLVHTGPTAVTTIGVARGEWTPAATLDRNRVSKAICLLGWYHTPDPRQAWTAMEARRPLDQEIMAIAEAFVYMVGQGWVSAKAEILGHRDNPAHPRATACPGDYLYAAIPDVRSIVAKLLDQPTPTPPTPTPPPSEEVSMRLVVAQDANDTIWIGDGMTRRVVPSMAVLNNYIVLNASGAQPLVNTNGQSVRDPSQIARVGGDTIEALGAHG